MRREKTRYLAAFLVLFLFLLVLAVWNMNAGSYAIAPGQVRDILLGRSGDETAVRIVWDLRLPRIAAAVLLGGALSIAGFLLQTFFDNPIAGPFVLGISSGAKLAVALTMIALLNAGLLANSFLMIAAAFVGAMLSMTFVLLVSRRVHRMSILIICGIMIGYICSALTDFVVTFADDSNIVNLHNWSMGSFSGITWSNVEVMAIVVGLAVLWAFFLSKPMGAYQQGESYAKSLGVNLGRLRGELILLSSLLSACVTAFAGPVSFVGVAVPHLVRSLLGTTRPLVVIPGCFLGGGVFCLFCDLIARTVFAPVELSISTVTALFGAPVVIYIMVRRQRNRH